MFVYLKAVVECSSNGRNHPTAHYQFLQGWIASWKRSLHTDGGQLKSNQTLQAIITTKAQSRMAYHSRPAPWHLAAVVRPTVSSPDM